MPKLYFERENDELLLNIKDHEYYCKHVGENLGRVEATAYRICFEKDRVSFCAGESKKVLYSISFEDPNFDDRLKKLSHHLRVINDFFIKLNSEIVKLGSGLMYDGFLFGEIKLCPVAEMRAGFGEKSSEKLVSILVSTDYRSVTLVTQNNGGHPVTNEYDLSKPEDAGNLLFVYNGYRECEEEGNYVFDKENVILEKLD